MMMRVLMVLALGLIAMLATGRAHAGGYCPQPDSNPVPLPASLVPAAEKAFGIHTADTAWVERSTVMRCMGGKLLACNMGANLPCGKANTATSLPAGDDWCRQNPNADFIPAYISGHDSAEPWRCANGVPAIAGPAAAVDAQGYLMQYWKVLE